MYSVSTGALNDLHICFKICLNEVHADWAAYPIFCFFTIGSNTALLAMPLALTGLASLSFLALAAAVLFCLFWVRYRFTAPGANSRNAFGV